jgi:hypothetical protein
MYYSSSLRIDVRFLPFISGGGMQSSTVTGIHATAIEVIGGDCDAKLEIYSRYQTESGKLQFLLNRTDVG